MLCYDPAQSPFIDPPKQRPADSVREIERARASKKEVRRHTGTPRCAPRWWSARGRRLESRDPYSRRAFSTYRRGRGQKRAIVAVAHQMLTIAYCMLKQGVPFRDAESVPRQRRRKRRAHHHPSCLRRLGLSVRVAADSNGVLGETA